MVLEKIHFDSFKSLVNEKLEITSNCTGIVGINESGKSNILQAVRILNEDFHLEKKHVPKISKTLNPKLRFQFSPKRDQEKKIKEDLQSWFDTNTLVKSNFESLKLKIEYSIELDLESENEVRSFQIRIQDYDLKDSVVLKKEFFDTEKKLFAEDRFIPLEEALVIPNSLMKTSEKDLDQLKKSIEECKNEIAQYKNEKLELENQDKDRVTLIQEIEKLENNISKSEKQLNDLNKKLEFDFEKIIEKEEKEIIFLEEENNELKNNIEVSEIQKNTLKSKPFQSLSTSEKGLLTKHTNNLKTYQEKLRKNISKLKGKKERLDLLNTPYEDIYSSEIENLGFYFSQILEEDLKEFLPKVVFWEYSEDFILKSRTSFDDILNKEKLSQISRPLLNVFRVGLKIDSLKELKHNIKLIQEDDGERSRINDQLNENLNAHIDNVWADYDQDVKITLEEHQIRIQFFDPEFKGKSYFNMAEKSQGAQTFLSFLMTVGAEAAQGVLKNTILLLDEPETHLHPSGVRYMLQELIKISEKSNIVIYATHSIFMIDKENYDRHIYLIKKEEKTSINVSKKDRIGYFMQEEVLFAALDFDLENDLNTKNVVNFVFEGHGDVIIFKNFYETFLKESERPFNLKNSTFYQGGKCSDIKKFLIKNPIKLGTKWIFIIDDDSAANDLKKFLEGKYKDYINKDIFVYQYKKEGKKESELEDLLPQNILKSIYTETGNCLKLEVVEDNLRKYDFENDSFAELNVEILNDLNIPDKTGFKAVWKNNLNLEIENISRKTDKKDLIIETYPEYSEWFKSVIEKLKHKKN